MRWWLSFAGDEGSIGVAIIEAHTFIEAVQKSHRLGCNPGGEVAGAPIPQAVLDDDPILNTPVDRMLTKDEIKVLAIAKNDSRHEVALSNFYDHAQSLCPNCRWKVCTCH